jgi:hypothetical protein
MIDVLFWVGFAILVFSEFGVTLGMVMETVKPLAGLVVFLMNLLVMFVCLYGALHF